MFLGGCGCGLGAYSSADYLAMAADDERKAASASMMGDSTAAKNYYDSAARNRAAALAAQTTVSAPPPVVATAPTGNSVAPVAVQPTYVPPAILNNPATSQSSGAQTSSRAEVIPQIISSDTGSATGSTGAAGQEIVASAPQAVVDTTTATAEDTAADPVKPTNWLGILAAALSAYEVFK